MRFSFLQLLLFFTAVHCSYGQAESPVAEPDSVYILPGIEVSSTRYGLASAKKAVRVSTIDRKTTEATAAIDAGELLTRASPLFIRRYGSGLSLPVLRGNNAVQTLLLIDGVPLTDPQLGQIDLSIIPTSLLQNVSVMHGAGGALYGSSSMAGVINFQSRSPTESPFSMHSSVGVGAFGKRHADVSVSNRVNQMRTYFSLSHHTEQGDFPYQNRSLFPPRTSRRDSAAREHTSLFGKLDLAHRRSRTTFAGWVNQSARNLPGLATATPQGERQWDGMRRGWVQHVRPFYRGALTLRSAYQRSRLRYLHPVLDLDQTSHTTSLALTSEWSQPLAKSWTLDTGIDANHREASHPGLRSGAQEFQGGLFMKGYYSSDRIHFYPTWRLDTIHSISNTWKIVFNPGLGINLQPFRSRGIHFKAKAGHSYRTPTFNDRFWQPGGNPDLLPETGWNYEAGIHLVFKGATLETTLYRQHLQNQISWIPGENGFWFPSNLNRTRITGTETTLKKEWPFSSKLTATTSLIHTFTNALDQSNSTTTFGKPLRYVPRHQLKNVVALNYRRAHWRVSADLFTRYTDRRYITTDASQSLPAYASIDAQIRNSWITNATSIHVGIVLENVTNEAYEVIKGYPSPPRTIRVVLSIAWPGQKTDV